MLAPTKQLMWNATGAGGAIILGFGAGAIAWSDPIALYDVEQIGILASVMNNAVCLRLQFAADDTVPLWRNEIVEELGALVGGVRQYTPAIKEWALGKGHYHLSRPADAHLVRFGVYTVAAVNPNDFVVIGVERQRTTSQLGAA